MLVLFFEIFLVIVAIGGLTFATSRLLGSQTIIKFGEYNVDYVGDTEIVVSDLEPVSDKLIDINKYSNEELTNKNVNLENNSEIKEQLHEIKTRIEEVENNAEINEEIEDWIS